MVRGAKRPASVAAAPTLADKVEISRLFLRSVRLDADFGRLDALDGYVFQGTARAALESMAKQLLETQQRAFTWTGPYGGGKSSLALALASLVSRDAKLRT
jgi:DNA replication protein DnaC